MTFDQKMPDRTHKSTLDWTQQSFTKSSFVLNCTHVLNFLVDDVFMKWFILNRGFHVIDCHVTESGIVIRIRRVDMVASHLLGTRVNMKTLNSLIISFTNFIHSVDRLASRKAVDIKVAPATIAINYRCDELLAKFDGERVQWNKQYFNANETAMKCALMIVFFQKLHRKILDFCIF